jgi:hypothetical protein
MKNNAKQGSLMLALFCTLASVVTAGNSDAAVATARASVTIIEPISVSLVGAFDPETPTSSKSGGAFDPETPTSSKFVGAFDPATLSSSTSGSTSGSSPLLRFGDNPPAGTVTIIIDTGSGSSDIVSSDSGGSSGGSSSDGAPSPPKNAKVVLTKNPDGTVSIRVTGKVGLTFSVTQHNAGTVTVEYN